MTTIKECLQNFKGLIQVSPLKEEKKWSCRQCSQVDENEADFAKHLRSHLTGHRGRIHRKPAKSKDAQSSKHDKLSANSTFIKFDSLTSSQFEISQPNTVTNLMHINYQNREMCEQLVDPSLVMPSKHTENSMECSEFNYTEILNFTNIPNGVTIDNGQNANNLIMELNSFSNEKDVNLKILADAVANNVDNGQQMNIQNLNDENLGTITPLNLYYIEGGHFASTVPNVEISEVNEVISADQNNMVIVDNSVDKTVRLIDLNGQIISGGPFGINTLSANDIEVPKAAMFVCEICRKQFTTQAYLYRHLRKHTGEFSCNYCNSVFTRKETWITHCCVEKKAAEAHRLSQIQEKDHKVVPDSAPIAPNDVTPTKKDVSKEPQPKKPPPLKKSKSLSCTVCNLSLSDSSCLKRHMLTHEKSLCYTCVYCGTVVAHRHSIRRHLKLQHPEYEHEWNNTEFITSLQTEVRKRSADDNSSNKTQNAKKKKFSRKTSKDSPANIKLPSHCPKKDSLLGTTMVDDKLDFDCHLLKNNTSQSREYLNNEKSQSVTSVKDDSLDLSSFTAHFDEDIGHISFQALALPDILCKGGDIVKLDSKENSPIKNFNIGSLLVFNPNGTKKTSEFLPEITFGEQLSNSSLNKINCKSLKDANVFCSTSFLSANELSPEKVIRVGNCLKTDKDKGISEIFVSPLKSSDGLGGMLQMPSMPVLLCEEEKMEALAKVDEFNAGMEILLCQALEAVPLQPSLDQQRCHRPLLQQEETNPSCSAGYVLEENTAMQLVDTSNDFTFYVLG